MVRSRILIAGIPIVAGAGVLVWTAFRPKVPPAAPLATSPPSPPQPEPSPIKADSNAEKPAGRPPGGPRPIVTPLAPSGATFHTRFDASVTGESEYHTLTISRGVVSNTTPRRFSREGWSAVMSSSWTSDHLWWGRFDVGACVEFGCKRKHLDSLDKVPADRIDLGERTASGVPAPLPVPGRSQETLVRTAQIFRNGEVVAWCVAEFPPEGFAESTIRPDATVRTSRPTAPTDWFYEWIRHAVLVIPVESLDAVQRARKSLPPVRPDTPKRGLFDGPR